MVRGYLTIAGRLNCSLEVEGSGDCRCDGAGRQLWLYTISHDDVSKAVEEETAILGERRRLETKGGDVVSLLEELVMDGEYDNLFRRYFDDARAELVSLLPTRCLEGSPSGGDPKWLDGTDVRSERDFVLWIWLKKDMPLAYRSTIDKLLLRYLVDYVVYRWLETKSEGDAASYYNRLEGTKGRIVKVVNYRGGRGLKRKPSFP